MRKHSVFPLEEALSGRGPSRRSGGSKPEQENCRVYGRRKAFRFAQMGLEVSWILPGNIPASFRRANGRVRSPFSFPFAGRHRYSS